MACEDCQIIGYGQMGKTIDISYDRKETILGAISGLGAIKGNLGSDGPGVLPDLSHFIHDQKLVDNMLVFSVNPLVESQIENFVRRYHQFVNPKLLFVDVSLNGTSSSLDSLESDRNYIKISGFSDQILRFVGERGDSAQILQVENVDLKFGLRQEKEAVEENSMFPKLLPAPDEIPQTKPVKVFISSTFKDFHSERNIMTQFVFPEIKSQASLLGIDVQEVDLRWGITEEESMRQDNAVERCLQQVQDSFIFVGMLGKRYGSVPNLDNFDDCGLAKDMVTKYPGASITELECHLGMQKPKGRVFFFFRDGTFCQNIDESSKIDFVSHDATAREKLHRLKKQIVQSGHETFLDYPCEWGGLSKKGKPILIGLEDFALKALRCIWQCLTNEFQMEQDDSNERAHVDFGEKEAHGSVGRIMETRAVIDMLDANSLIVISGKTGVGKTAFAAHVSFTLNSYNADCILLQHYVGIVPGSHLFQKVLQNLYNQLCDACQIQSSDLPLDELIKQLSSSLLRMIKNGKNIVIVVDGLDSLESPLEFCDLQWLPSSLPKTLKVILTCQESSTDVLEKMHKHKKLSVKEFSLKGMDLLVRKEMVRKVLEKNGKKLEESVFNNQMHMLVSKKDACFPRYVSLACSEVKIYGEFDNLTKIIQCLPPTKDQLIKQMVEKLEDDYGNNYVGLTFQLLSISEKGLTTSELEHMLCQLDNFGISNSGKIDGNPFHRIQNEEDFVICYSAEGMKKIPYAFFQPFVSRLQSIINHQKSIVDVENLVVTDDFLKKLVTQKYLKAKQLERKVFFSDGKQFWTFRQLLHLLLSCFHLSKISTSRNGNIDNSVLWKSTEQREVEIQAFRSEFSSKSSYSFVQLLHHLKASESWKVLKSLVTNLNFIQGMASLKLFSSLLEIYHILRQKEDVDQQIIHSYQIFVSKNAKLFRDSISTFWQQALNEQTLVKNEATNLLYASGNARLPPKCSALAVMTRSTKCTSSLVVELPAIAEDQVSFLAFSPNSKLLGCGTFKGIITVYDITNSSKYATFVGHSSSISCILFLRSDRLISASSDSTVCLWDVRNKNRLKVITQHKDVVVKDLKAHPNEAESFASVALDSKIFFWKSKTGEEISKISSKSPINCVSYHPHGLKVSTGHWDSTVRIFEVLSSQQKAVLRGHDHAVRHVSYTQTGHQILSIDLAGYAIYWQADINLPIRIFEPHRGLPVTALTVGNTSYFSGDKNGLVKVWPISFCVPEYSLKVFNATCLTMTQGETTFSVAVGFHSGQVQEFIINKKTYSLLEVKSAPDHHSKRVTSITYFETLGRNPSATYHEEKHILTTSDDGTFKIFSHIELKCEFSLTAQVGLLQACVISPISSNDVNDASYNVDLGEDILVVTSNTNCEVKVHSIIGYSGFPKTAQVAIREINLNGHTAPVTGISYSRAKSMLFTSGRDGLTYLWNIKGILGKLYSSSNDLLNLKPIAYQHIHSDWINSSCWSGEWNGLVTCSNDNTLRLSSLDELQTIMTTDMRGAHEAGVLKVIAKDKIAFTASQDGFIGIWSKSKDSLVQLNRLTLAQSKPLLDLGVIQQKQSHRSKDQVKDMTDVIELCHLVSLSSDSIDFWQPFQVSNQSEIPLASGVSALASSGSTSNICSNQIAVACTNGHVGLWQPSQDQTSELISQHNAPIIAVEFLSLDGVEVIISASTDGHVQGHVHNEGILEPVLDSKIPLFEKLDILKVVALSPTFAIACCIGKGKRTKVNSMVSTLFIQKTHDGSFQTAQQQSHSYNTYWKLAKLFTLEKEIALAAAEVGENGKCFMNVYTLPSPLMAPSVPIPKMKFQIKESVPLADWVLDFCWIEQSIFLTFCNSSIQTISVSMKNPPTDKSERAFTNFSNKMILVGKEKDDDNGVKELIVTSNIIAYDTHQEFIMIATADNEVQFWCKSILRGTISINSKISDLSICKGSSTTSLEPTEMFVAVGCQHGELLIIRWIWTDEQHRNE